MLVVLALSAGTITTQFAPPNQEQEKKNDTENSALGFGEEGDCVEDSYDY